MCKTYKPSYKTLVDVYADLSVRTTLAKIGNFWFAPTARRGNLRLRTDSCLQPLYYYLNGSYDEISSFAWPTLRRQSVRHAKRPTTERFQLYCVFDRTTLTHHDGVGGLLAAPVWFQRSRIINNVLWRALCRFGLGGSRECPLSCSVT